MAGNARRIRPATCSVEAAAMLLGIGRSMAYTAARWRGELAPGIPVIKAGERRYRVPIRPLAQALGLSEDEVFARLRNERTEQEEVRR